MKPKIKRKIKTIIKYLSFVTLLTLVALVLMYYFTEIGSDILLSFICLAFMLISALVFIKAIFNSLKSKNKMAFIQVVMVNVFAKMLGILAIVVVYYKMVKPESKIIILPFILIYIIFSVVETIFTYKLAYKNS